MISKQEFTYEFYDLVPLLVTDDCILSINPDKLAWVVDRAWELWHDNEEIMSNWRQYAYNVLVYEFIEKGRENK